MHNANEQASNAIDRVEVRVSQILGTAVSVSTSITRNNDLISFIMADYENEFDRVKASWKYGDLSEHIIEHPYEIDGLFLYSDKYNVLNTGYIKNPTSEIRNTNWYLDARNNGALLRWAYTDNDNFSRRGLKNLTLCRSIFKGREFIGVLCIYINDKTFHDIINQEDLEIFIFDMNNQIVSCSDSVCFDMVEDEMWTKLTNDPYGQIDYNGEIYSSLSQTLMINDVEGAVNIVALYNNEKIVSPISTIAKKAYTIIVFGSLLSVIIVFSLSKIMSKRLEKISNDIHHVANGELNYKPVLDGADEIGNLSNDLNSMINNLRQLISENAEIKEQKQKLELYQRDIQLQILTNQVNPHFLFNTLESIRMSAIINGQDKISDAIQKLSRLMRKNLNTSDQPILFTDELLFVEDFLGLQKIRLGEQFDYQFNINDNTRDCLILPFLLQPLIENAIKHGLLPLSTSQGYVVVNAFQNNNTFIINVIDNGIGIDTVHLKELQQKLSDSDDSYDGGHIGLNNVHQRIQLYYGTNYGLSIQSTKGNGTISTLRIPYIRANTNMRAEATT
ncbi:hypothetical protein AGMMS49992_22720 [Clostridia bacterium]|nr:hypothetical protein AGMMS49992_22720 [Clostridia bacterium]